MRLNVLVALSTLVVVVARPGSAQRSADDLAGIWAADVSFGPAVRGELTLRRERAGGWSASIAGLEALARASGEGLRVVLPGGAGEFRGPLPVGTQALRGYWIQPPGVVLGSAYASPVTLSPIAPGVWSGTVTPLEERYSLYLVVRRQADGSLTGEFRNPDANHRGGAARFRLERFGDSLAFIDPAHAERRLGAAYDSSSPRITLVWRALGRTLDLTRRTPDQAVGLFPREPQGLAYAYRSPVPEGDGWTVARASAVGMDEATLSALVARIVIADTTTGADTVPRVHSVLVERHGKLVLEEYFAGFDRERVHDLRSASKTFTSVMLGVAIEQRAPIGPDTPVYPLFEAGRGFANPDPRKSHITIGQLLTHTSGLACDDADDRSPGNEDTMQGQGQEADWSQYTLDLPLAHPPGETYAYCSAGINLAVDALRRVTGVWVPEYFARFVARPLQIPRFYMNLTPTGEGYGGGGVRLRPRDFLKFGRLFLAGGVWNGHRVVSAAWVKTSTSAVVVAGPGRADGYAWHLNTLRAGGREYREYEANGNGGQFLIVVPELDLAVVFTAGEYGRYGVWRKLRDSWVPESIISAVRQP